MRAFFLLEILLPVLFIGWASVMVFGATVGATGYRALAELKNEEAILQKEVAVLADRRQWMENRAALMNSTELDPDMVDERIRDVLGFAHAGDIVIARDDLAQAIALLKKRDHLGGVLDTVASAEDSTALVANCTECVGLVAATP